MELEYLQSLLKKPSDEWMLEIDLSKAYGKSEGVLLWNLSVKLSELCGDSLDLQSGLSKIRFRACTILSDCFQKPEVDKYWLRTAKSFLDCRNFQSAELCLSKIDLASSSLELKFNYYLWKTQLLFLTEQDFLASLRESALLCKELPNEKFRLSRFLYVDICKKLQTKMQYHEMVEILIICQEISQGAVSEPLRQIYEHSKVLLCECFIEVAKYEKAEFLLEEMQSGCERFLLMLKLRVYTDRFEELRDIMKKMMVEVDQSTLQTAVDLLISRNKLIEACDCLKIITERYKTPELLTKWFKILFALESSHWVDRNLDCVDMCRVLDLITALKYSGSEYKKLLWDYISELYSAGSSVLALEYTEKYYLCISEGDEEANALVFTALCYLELKQPTKTLEILQNLRTTEEITCLRLRAQIQLGDFASVTFHVLSSLSPQEITQVLKELSESNTQLFEQFTFELSQKFIESLPKPDQQCVLLKWFCEHDTSFSRRCWYLTKAKEVISGADLEYFFAKAWNFSIQVEDPVQRVDLMLLSLDLAEKSSLSYSVNGCYVFATACREIIHHKVSKHYESLLQKIQCMPEAHRSQDTLLLEFELSILLKSPINSQLPSDYYYLKKLSVFCLENNDYEYSKISLERCLEIDCRCETVRELIRISRSFEEAEKYLKIALEQYNEGTGGDEVDWVVAVAWNNGIRAYTMYQDNNARNWIMYAVKISEKCNHPLSHRILQAYHDITNSSM